MPTSAELQALTDAQKAKEAAAATQAEEEQRRRSMWDWFKGFMPDFSFGGLLQMALIFTGLYFFARSEMGQQAIQWIAGKLDPEMQVNILGMLNKVGIDVDLYASLTAMDYNARQTKLKDYVSPEILEIIGPNDGNKTWGNFLTLIRDANGGKVTMRGFTSPETITALIQQKPDMALQLVTAAMKPKADGAANEMAASINGSLKTIIGSQQLDVLLNGTNRANTLQIVLAAMPKETALSEAKLNEIITKGLDANGKPTDALRKLFTDAVDNNKEAVQADVIKILGAKNIVSMVDPQQIKDEAARYVVTTLQQNPQAKAAQDALITTLGDSQTNALMTALRAPNAGTQVTKLILLKENVHALPQALALLDQLPGLTTQLPKEQAVVLIEARKFLTPARIPVIQDMVAKGIDPLAFSAKFLKPDGTFSMYNTVNALLDPATRNQIKQVGNANIIKLLPNASPFMNQRNLDAIVNFAGALDTTNQPNTARVVRALANLPNMPVHEAFQYVSSEQIAAFFSVPANQAAFKTLLNEQTGLVGDTVALQQELGLLRKNFYVTKDVGLVAILSDKDSAQFLLNAAKPKEKSLIPTPEFAQRWAMELNGGDTLDNSKNQDIILELGKALSAGTTTQSVATTTPNAADRAIVSR